MSLVWRRFKHALPPIGLFVFILLLWQWAANNGMIDDLVLPAPLDIARAFPGLFEDGLVWSHIRATTRVAVLGFTFGSAAAIFLAVVCALFAFLRRMIYPLMVALQVTPRIAIAPILVAWLGFGDAPRIVLVMTICFFPVFLNALTAMETVDRDAEEMFRALGANRRQTFTRLLLPGALPVTFAGLKTGMTFALLAAVVAEFVSAKEGLGVLINRFTYALNMDDAFGVLFILTMLGLLLFGIMEWLDRMLVFWRHDARLTKKSRRKAARAARRAARATKPTASAVLDQSNARTRGAHT